jgi:hypothetical protein
LQAIERSASSRTRHARALRQSRGCGIRADRADVVDARHKKHPIFRNARRLLLRPLRRPARERP